MNRYLFWSIMTVLLVLSTSCANQRLISSGWFPVSSKYQRISDLATLSPPPKQSHLTNSSLTLLEATAAPRTTRALQKVTFTTRYAIKHVSATDVVLYEKRQLWRGNQLVRTLSNEELHQGNGVWEGTFILQTPSTVTSGEYQLHHEIQSTAGRLFVNIPFYIQ